ncbi:nitroreductase family protein [Myxococcota bacterium]|nr:nitroreductase family protein [Myxococcota bacterium]MCZ7616831.1 nitroreductase family protein [Myxococcota bacterium]
MDLYDAMKTLRAVRRLRPDPIPDDVLRRVLEAATWAPTGGNVQPWRIVVVRDREKKQRLGSLYAEHWSAYTATHRKLLAKAPDAVRERNERMIRAGDHLSEHFADTPAVLVQCFHSEALAVTDAEQGRVSVVGGASVYPAIQNLLLACRAEGLGCVLTTLLCAAEPEVRALLGIPDPWYTSAAVPIGYPVLGGHGPISRRPVEKMVFADVWGAPF